MSVRSPTAGTWSSSPWRPANEFEMDRRGSADRAAVDGGRGPLNGRVAGHYGPIIPRFASVSGPHAARRQAHRRPTARDPAASAEPATAPQKPRRLPRVAPVAGIGAGGQTPRNVASIPNSARELGIRDAQVRIAPRRAAVATTAGGRRTGALTAVRRCPQAVRTSGDVRIVLGCRCRSKNFPDLSKQQSPTERDRTGICQRVSGLTHWNWSTSAGDSSLSAFVNRSSWRPGRGTWTSSNVIEWAPEGSS